MLLIKNKKQGRLKTIEESDKKIREIMFQEKFNEISDKHLNLLKENSEIVYFEDLIDEYFKK